MKSLSTRAPESLLCRVVDPAQPTQSHCYLLFRCLRHADQRGKKRFQAN
jgi:hypothetical protein